jgi:hypothetical protein
LFEVVDAPGVNGRADQFVLALQPFGERFVTESLGDQVVIRGTLLARIVPPV